MQASIKYDTAVGEIKKKKEKRKHTKALSQYASATLKSTLFVCSSSILHSPVCRFCCRRRGPVTTGLYLRELLTGSINALTCGFRTTWTHGFDTVFLFRKDTTVALIADAEAAPFDSSSTRSGQDTNLSGDQSLYLLRIIEF